MIAIFLSVYFSFVVVPDLNGMKGVKSSVYDTNSNHASLVNVTKISHGIYYPSIGQLFYAVHYLPSYISPMMLDSNLQEFYDKFGILKIYPTSHKGEEWYMNMTAPNSDARFDIAHDERFDKKSILIDNGDGSWKERSPQVRLEVLTSDGYNESKIATFNQTELSSKGYMQSPRDWKNVEMTGFVKYNEGKREKNDNPDQFTWYARGGDHETSDKGCEGSAYKGLLSYNGDSRFAKEQYFVNYDFTDTKVNVTSPLKGKWFGFKFVVYNIHLKNGSTVSKMENWINENADGVTWKRVDEKIDNGGWGTKGQHCMGSSDEIITWGGPIAVFRWDNAKDVDIKDFSVREIQSK
jgi:hypothetical protein